MVGVGGVDSLMVEVSDSGLGGASAAVFRALLSIFPLLPKIVRTGFPA